MKWQFFASGLVLVSGMAANVPAEATETVELRSTANDCAIFAALAKARLNWTVATAPKGTFIAVSTEYDSDRRIDPAVTKPSRRYTIQCHWADFNLAEPVANSGPDSFSFGRPHYSGPDRATAGWTLYILEKKNDRFDVHPRGETCDMAKDDGQWRIVSCKTAGGYFEPPSSKLK